MDSCGGTLLVHIDGEPAACTEELEGRCCAGVDAPHAGELACEALLGPGACELCAMTAWTPRLWRHAVHVGTMAAGARRCRAHTAARRRRAAEPATVLVVDPTEARALQGQSHLAR
jgi:hypothetical protein